MHDRLLRRVTLAVVVFGSTLCADLRAEIVSRIPGDFGWRKSIPLQLILENVVVEDLELREEVAAKLKQLHEHIQAEVAAERSKPTENRQEPAKPDRWVRNYQWNDAILHVVRNRHSDELNALLTPQQQERLYQIHLRKQRKPTDTLCDPAVAKELGLTDTQRSEIYQRHREVVRAEMDEVKMGGKYTGPRSSTLEKACPETVMRILNDEQRQTFQRLQGQPVKSSPK